MKKRSDKEMIHTFTDLATDLKYQGFKNWYHVMDNKASTTSEKIKTQKSSIS